MDQQIFAQRRRQLLAAIGDGLAILPAAPVQIHSHDVGHDYRQDSDFFYLTGFDEPQSVLVLDGRSAEAPMTLFVRSRDPVRERWDGARAGVEGACAQFGADVAYPIDELSERLPELMANRRQVFCRLGQDRSFDDTIFAAVRDVRRRARTGVQAPSEFVDVGESLHAARLIKSSQELAAIAGAGAITRLAHLQAMEVARPGAYEYEVEAELLRVFRRHGAERPAYGSIVASGSNATILHHRRNDRRMEEGDLLLIDAAAELDYYASDVTRTFPISGRFTRAQRALYEVVLKAQTVAIDAVRPGTAFDDVHKAALRVLVAGLVDLGLLEGPVDDAIEKKRYEPFYMHRTSHFLGMDVHDVGHYFEDGRSRPLLPGMVLTVEPGLYIALDADVPEEFRGIGIRIEDDIAVTEDGSRNLTPNIPKDPDELERLLAERRDQDRLRQENCS